MKVRFFWVVAWVLSFVACGGTSSVQPPPPPAPGIARVELVSDKGTIFQGHAVPGQAFVARVMDSAGNIVTDATLTAVASPGWTVRGDTVIAPQAEGTGTMRIVATRKAPQATAAYGVALAAAPVDSAISPAIAVASIVNLDTVRLHGTMTTCRQNLVNNARPVTNDSVGPIDSVQYTPALDSVRYTDQPTNYVIANYGLSGLIWVSGPLIMYGSSLSYPFHAAHYPAYATTIALSVQVPDTLILEDIDTRLLTRVPRGTVLSYSVPGVLLCPGPSAAAWTADSTVLSL